MKKEKIIQKLKIKDYNKELEEVLLNKNFSKNTKNLLSSMLYKIENSYEDYKKVKVNIPSKKEILEELIDIIKKDCIDIKIIKPNLEEAVALKGKKSVSIQEEKKIITYQNELALLKAIYELKVNEINSNELNEKAVLLLLNEGEITSKSEIMRDFDGWSWNIMTSEIENYIPNLVYQFIFYVVEDKSFNKNTIQNLETSLNERYKALLTEKILNFMIQLSVLNYIKKYPEEKQVLEQLKENLQNMYTIMDDKKKYIEEITDKKKAHIKEIEKIDKYINDDLALKKEYIKQNEVLPQEKRVFSLSDFSEQTQKRRDFLEAEVKILTDKIKPQNFVKEKNKIEKNLTFFKEIEESNTNIFIQEFIKLCLKAINKRYEKIETKKEVLDNIYILRYLKLINVDEQKTAGDLCKKYFEKTEKNLITLGCNLKAINILSKDVEENYKIYKNIFNTKIIDLESVYIEVDNENRVFIYDENSLEKEEIFKELKELSVKRNKKTKIFM